MKLLTFKIKYADKKWPVYLEETFGKETAEKFSIESNATAKTNEATINLVDFDGNSKVINIVKNDKNVISAFIVDNYKVKKVIV